MEEVVAADGSPAVASAVSPALSVSVDSAAAHSLSSQVEATMVSVEEDAATPRASIFARAASTLASRASRVITLPRTKARDSAIEETESDDGVQSEESEHTNSFDVAEINTTAGPPLLPWQTRDENGDAVDDIVIRQKILGLTVFRSTYTEHPGGEEEFVFEFATYAEIAKQLLLSDPSLREMHTELIPTAVDEIAFWRNFFLRCNAIRLELKRPPYLAEAKSTFSTYSAVASLQKLKRDLYLRRRSSTDRIRRTLLRPRNSSADASIDAFDVELGDLDLDLDGEIDRELRMRRPSRAVPPGA